jgi:hypothetical protein
MGSWLDFSIDTCHMQIKNYRTAYQCQFSIFLFNIVLAVFNSYYAYHNQSFINYGSAGCFVIGCVWSLIFFIDSRIDYKNEMYRVKHLKELRDKRDMSSEMEGYKNARKLWESYMSGNVEEKKESGDVVSDTESNKLGSSSGMHNCC